MDSSKKRPNKRRLKKGKPSLQKRKSQPKPIPQEVPEEQDFQEEQESQEQSALPKKTIAIGTILAIVVSCMLLFMPSKEKPEKSEKLVTSFSEKTLASSSKKSKKSSAKTQSKTKQRRRTLFDIQANNSKTKSPTETRRKEKTKEEIEEEAREKAKEKEEEELEAQLEANLKEQTKVQEDQVETKPKIKPNRSFLLFKEKISEKVIIFRANEAIELLQNTKLPLPSKQMAYEVGNLKTLQTFFDKYFSTLEKKRRLKIAAKKLGGSIVNVTSNNLVIRTSKGKIQKDWNRETRKYVFTIAKKLKLHTKFLKALTLYAMHCNNQKKFYHCLDLYIEQFPDDLEWVSLLYQDIKPKWLDTSAKAKLNNDQVEKASKIIKSLIQDYQVAKKAEKTLSQMGPSAVASILYTMVSLFRSERPAYVDKVVAKSIHRMGPEAIKFLFAIFHLKLEPGVYAKSIEVLENIGVGLAATFKIKSYLQTGGNNRYIIGIIRQAKRNQILLPEVTIRLKKEVAHVLKTDPKRPSIKMPITEAIYSMGPHAAIATPLLAQLLQHEATHVVHRGLHALGTIGKKAKAAISEVEKSLENESLKVKAIATLGKIGNKECVPILTDLLQNPDNAIKLQAVQALGEIGPDAFTITPLLVKILKDKKSPANIKIAAARSIGKMGKKNLQTLFSLHNSKDKQMKSFAILAFGQIEHDKKMRAIVPLLQKALKDQNANTRNYAAMALVQMGKVGILAKALKKERANVKLSAISGLEQIGEKAIPFLAPALWDKHASVRDRVASIFGKMGAKAIVPLKRAAYSNKKDISFSAIKGLFLIGPEILPVLEKTLRNPHKNIRLEAVTKYRTMNVKMASINKRLFKMVFKDRYDKVRIEIIYILSKMEPQKTVPILMKIAKRPGKNSVRYAAITSLGNLRSKAVAAIDTLAKTSRDKNESIRTASIEALGKINRHPKILPVFIQALGDSSTNLRLVTVRILEKWMKQASKAAPKLKKMFPRQKKAVKKAIISTIAMIELEQSVPFLRNLLKKQKLYIRNTAIKSLGKLRYYSKAAIPDLLALTRSKEKSTQVAAIWSLERIAPTNSQVISTLVTCLKNRDKEIKMAAITAFARMQKKPASAIPILNQLTENSDAQIKVAAKKALIEKK